MMFLRCGQLAKIKTELALEITICGGNYHRLTPDRTYLLVFSYLASAA